jgi:RNA polymerase sigma factor (sigma-70 family)
VEASALSHPIGIGRVSLAGPLLRLRSDEQLVSLFRAGHDEAFGTIHDRYRVRLLAYARQMLGGSRSDAEDVLQDVFLRAYHALRADRREVALRAWLYRVAHNRCIDQLRRPTPAAEDIFDVNRGSVQEQPDEAAERREDLRRLIADVRELPEQQRSALLMREMEGLSYNELADALGVTVPAIKSLLVRARIGLVEAIEARDTACVEIRDDLVSAFDRGVRVSGRAKKHLRECSGCREYRGKLRGVEKQLSGLAPSHGVFGLVAKLLGVGGAGSGGGAFALGGGAAAGGSATVGTAAVSTGGIATLGGGAVATKVVAVVAAAAVVGGGAATVQKVERAVQAPARHERTVVKATPAAAPVKAASTPAAAVSGQATSVHHSALSHTGGLRPAHHGGAAAAPAATHERSASATKLTETEEAPALAESSGGLEAPSDASETTPVDPGGSGTATSGAGGDATTGAGSTATATPEQATTPPATAAAPTTGTAGTSGTTTAGSPSSGATAGGASAPSGTVSAGATGPVAQGATASPTP